MPSRAERGVTYFAVSSPPIPPYPVPIALLATGDPNFSSEHVLSYEAGHRFEIRRNLSVQSSVFYSRYDDLRGLSPYVQPFDPTAFPPHMDVTLDAANSLAGHTYGGNFSVRWTPHPRLELRGSVELLRMRLHEMFAAELPDPSAAGLAGNTPREQYDLLARWRPAKPWALDLNFRHVGPLPQSRVPAYDGLDARLAWTPRPHWELELIGRDLLEPRHEEIGSFFLSVGAQPIARSIYLRVTFRH
jgi:iron complex outermembrane receptor protein